MNKITGLQEFQLDILKQFAYIAERESLTWFAMFGTLLGAVRHGGFIPWDDDIDVALPRADYDRLRKSKNWFDVPYFLQTPQNDPSGASHFIKLRRSDTAMLKGFPDNLTRGGNMGVCIDILPLDDVPGGVSAQALSNTACQIQRQMLATAALDECPEDEIPDCKQEFCYAAGGIAGHYDFLAQRYERFCSKYSGEPYYSIPVSAGVRGCRVFDKEWFASSVKMEFESLSIPAPAGWKEVLIASYPEGTYEPKGREREQPCKDKYVIDLKRSYKYYVRRYTDMLCGIEGKKVFLFGAGDSLRIWMERYSKGLDVVCTFDNSPAKHGTTAYGVRVGNPEKLPEFMYENSRLIVTSIYHEEIAKQLESMEINDFYIFIDGFHYERNN